VVVLRTATKGATATQLCLMCKRTRSLSVKQALLDATHGTLQDVSGSGNLRDGTHFADRVVMDDATRTIAMPGTPDHHCSVARSPLLVIIPGGGPPGGPALCKRSPQGREFGISRFILGGGPQGGPLGMRGDRARPRRSLHIYMAHSRRLRTKAGADVQRFHVNFQI